MLWYKFLLRVYSYIHFSFLWMLQTLIEEFFLFSTSLVTIKSEKYLTINYRMAKIE